MQTEVDSTAKLKNIYCLSGLGADRRVYKKLKLKGYQPVHLDWIEPKKNETISQYACRLSESIEEPNPIIVGLSFGGIVAVELAKQIQHQRTILISSVKETTEIPWYFRIFRWLPIHRLIPFKSLVWAVYWAISWFFGLETLEGKQLLRVILADTDPVFMKWAIDRVVRWDNQTVPDGLHHIHGTSDRIFPLKFVKADITLEGGGHFMILNRANKISQIIDRLICS